MASKWLPDKKTESFVASISTDDDDKELEALGYVPSFKREFTNLATVRWALNTT